VTVDAIASAGNKLWKELVGDRESLKVTSVQLAFTGIEFAESGQQTIEEFLRPSSSKKRPPDGEHVNPREPKTGAVNAETGADDLNATYICPRCGKSFYLPADASISEEGPDGIIDPEYIAKVKLEHEDFHFAQDLANEGRSRSVISVSSKLSPSSSSSAKRRKPRSDSRGIEKFFRRSP
jgi:DNA polymerase eta